MCVVFAWTRTVISQQYLDAMPLGKCNDKETVIKDMAMTAKVQVEWNSDGQIFLEGDWRQLLEIEAMLSKWREKREAVVPVPRTVLHHIKQKYLNVSRRRRRPLPQMTPAPEQQENEVYVNITVSNVSLFGATQDLVVQNPPASSEKKPCVKKKDYEKLAPYKFFCKSCSFKSKRESHYQRHLELHKKVSELYSCCKCDFTTIRLGHLRRHELTHSDSKLKCDMCDYHTDLLKLLLRHQRIKHCRAESSAEQKQLLQCSECDYNTTRQYLYQRHLQAHASTNNPELRDEHRFSCEQCSYKTSRKEHLIRHVNNVHNNKRPYLCDHCGKAFKRPDALKQHRVTHVQEDVLRCPVCEKCCRTQAQLTQHLAVHSNVRAFLCEICGSSFKTRAVQRKHILTIHKNPKAFSCVQCSRKFNTKYALRRHMKQHSMDRKRKDEVATLEQEQTLRVLMSEPQKPIAVQVISLLQ